MTPFYIVFNLLALLHRPDQAVPSEQFYKLVRMDLARELAQQELQPSHQEPAHDWAVVHEFGSSKCLIDRSSIETRGGFARALVRYSLVPPGTDKRNNKEVAEMLNVEEYDLRKGVFRVRRIVFQYIDGTESEPLSTDLEWKPATGGNQQTLKFLQELQ